MVRKLTYALFFLTNLVLASFTAKACGNCAHLSFFENNGQWETQVLFKSEISNGAIFLESDAITLNLYNREQYLAYRGHLHHQHEYTPRIADALQYHAYRIHLLNANPHSVISKNDKVNWYQNYYLGNDKSRWASGVKGFETLSYSDIYPGIDLKIASENVHLKYEFKVHAGAKNDLIALNYEGISGMYLKDGDLIIPTAVDTIIEPAPYAYQDISGKRVRVRCEYVLDNNTLRFRFPEGYDHNSELIIDPTIIFSTYSGSLADNFGYTATYDKYGNAFAGSSVFGNGYPTTLGAYQLSWAGGTGLGSIPGTDIAITKYNSKGSQRLYSTYLGGHADELPHSLIVNSNDEVFLLGTTSSDNFPVTRYAYDTTFAGGSDQPLPGLGVRFFYGSDIILCRMSADGRSLMASTFMGGTKNDGLNTASALKYNYADEVRGEILIDPNDNIIVGSCSFSPDFPTTRGSFQPSLAGGSDGVMFKMDNNLSRMLWSTFLGGSADDAIYSIEIDKQNEVLGAGGTNSPDFPVTAGSYRTFFGGGRADGFVSTITPNGAFVRHSTYIGSSEYDQTYFVEMNKNQDVFLLGQTQALGDTFIYNASYFFRGGGQYVMKLNERLDSLYWSTAFGTAAGRVNISPTAFLVDVCNKAYICGWGGYEVNRFGGTTGLDITPDAIQDSSDNNDFYLLVIADDASSITYGSYFGGALSPDHVDGGTSRFDRNGVIYQSVCASCGATQDFPIYPARDSVVSPTNNSPNCNNAIFKFDFNLPIVLAAFDIPPVRCSPASVTFRNTSKILPTTSYKWYFGDGDSSTLKNPTHNYLSGGTYQVMLIVSDPNSCNLVDTAIHSLFILSNRHDTLSALIVCDSSISQIGLPPINDSSVTYSWSPTTNLNRSDIANPIATITGNMTYRLLISNGACTDTLYQPVKIFAASLFLQGGAVLCPHDTLRLHVENTIPGESLSYTWSPSELIISGANTPNPLVAPPDTTVFYVLAVNSQGCTYTDSINVFTGLAGPDVSCYSEKDTFEVGESIGLHALIYQDVRFEWTPATWLNNATLKDPVSTPQSDIEYIVTVTDSNGCRDRDTLHLYRRALTCGQSAVFIPNAFSPNGDGFNDVFHVRGYNFRSMYLAIFDRWGQKVFESRDPSYGWDGTFKGEKLDPAVFGYYLEIECERGDKQFEKGNITLVR